jgi:hypothetical protein
MHTKDKLADALLQIGLMDMSLKARGGYYHDFLSPLDTPELQLIHDLYAKRDTPGALELRQRVMNGEFDASVEESDEWAASPDGQYAMTQLMKGDKRGQH